MGSLLTFINNIRYLSRFDVKKMYLHCKQMEYALDHIRYEIEADLRDMKRVNILNAEETLDKLLNSDCSMSRFGDGEIMLAFGENIASQDYSDAVSSRLKEVLASKNDKLMVCIPRLFDSLAYTSLARRKYDREVYGHYTPDILKLLHENRNYYNPSLSSYICTGAKDETAVKRYENKFNAFRTIWQDKDIAIVCGERVFKYVKNNIYDNAASIEYIYAPTNNAFKEYDSILERVKKVSRDKLIILILGPTASVLAYDLCNLGYRALDLGHLGKDYDAFIRRIENTPENIKKFFNAE